MFKTKLRDFPGGPVVENPSCNTGDASSIPGRGTKMPHGAGQLSLCATTTEPTRSGVWAPQLESPHAATTELARSGARTPRLERSLRTAVRSPHAAMEDPTCGN